jgi:CDP-diacylglycerol--serine O-phosphatidyltransferase
MGKPAFAWAEPLLGCPMASAGGSRYNSGMTFSPYEPDPIMQNRRRFKRIPVRMLVPNLITLLALCAGLTAIRLAIEGRLEFALAAIVFAAFLDGVDGRVARLIKGQSRFGAELDSLADFVNFGVTPALVLYFWGLHELKNFGWIAALVFAICGSLRLARFNVMAEDPNRPAWAGNFFVGVPAPAGAIIVLLPIYLHFLGVPKTGATAPLTLVYTLIVAFLMVSRLPVYSGKKAGTRVPTEAVLPIFVVVVLFFALLLSYPWEVLTIGTVLYLGSLPFGRMSYLKHQKRDADDNAINDKIDTVAAASSHPTSVQSRPSSPPNPSDANRPPRLN